MKKWFYNIITSGFRFSKSQVDLKYRYKMINIIILLEIVGLTYGVISNTIIESRNLIILESLVIFINILLIFILRTKHKIFEYIVFIITVEFTFLYLYFIYFSEPETMQHAWLFTYPIILLLLQDSKKRFLWMVFLISMLTIAPLQNIIEIKYSFYQATYLSFILILIHTVIYFYQLKINNARDKILEQQMMLLNFNNKLENQVLEKTAELIELNESLENIVQDKIDELIQKDKLINVQSKQAVMGEMISMIAHQWRQPLSTITLQIANWQLKRLIGEEVRNSELDETLSNINDSVIYLSDTIDDFKTYFHSGKDISDIEIHELLQKAVNFTLSRIQEIKINIIINKKIDINIKTYSNELIQVILNILNNAIDAHYERKVKTPTITLSIKEKENNILIYIVDNAGGIKNEFLPSLFEPYFSTKGKNGTGLGLYMSQMIIKKQFNGEISASSSDNISTFIISISKNISKNEFFKK